MGYKNYVGRKAYQQAKNVEFRRKTKHYVLFDGTSHYVTDEQDMLNLTKKDKDIEVVFKSMNFDIACDKADELNELL